MSNTAPANAIKTSLFIRTGRYSEPNQTHMHKPRNKHRLHFSAAFLVASSLQFVHHQTNFAASCNDRGPPIWYNPFRPPSDWLSICVGWPNRPLPSEVLIDPKLG